jgi:hypothetical protein
MSIKIQQMLRLFCAGELTSIYVPIPEDEAIRDLIRCRDDMKRFERKARQRLLSFLLRQGHQYSGNKNWTNGFYTWLATVQFSHCAQQITLQEYIEAAWAYKMQARVSTILLKRQQGLPKSVCDISWKAQTRLCARYRRLFETEKPTLQNCIGKIFTNTAETKYCILISKFFKNKPLFRISLPAENLPFLQSRLFMCAMLDQQFHNIPLFYDGRQ